MICYSVAARRLASSAAASRASGSSEQVTKGKYQHWRKPVYQAPILHPLEKGPDFSFNDGRPVAVTSKVQLNYKLDQLRLGRKILELLGEVKRMEEIHSEMDAQRDLKRKETERWTPMAKGDKLIQ